MLSSSISQSDSARAQLRHALTEYFHAQPVAAPRGYHSWPVAAPAASPDAASPDSVVLMENLKILKQYAKLLSQACHQQQQGEEHASAHAQPLSSNPPAYPRNLAWFEPLAKPYTGTDATAMDRVNMLLELHQAACGGQLDPATIATPRQHAYQLAKTLPHFDRDLTAYYLRPPADTTREYELHVAHSILRLHSPATLESLQTHLKTWRSQGLLHVLGVAALHMPELADWFQSAEALRECDGEIQSLAHCLEALRSRPTEHMQTLASFIASQDPATPTAQAIAVTIDRLAVLMGVKSNPRDDSSHDLAGALSNFPNLDALEAHDIWALIKPSLEQAFPPSLLRLDPAYARKRVSKNKNKQASGSSSSSWCAPSLSYTTCMNAHIRNHARKRISTQTYLVAVTLALPRGHVFVVPAAPRLHAPVPLPPHVYILVSPVGVSVDLRVRVSSIGHTHAQQKKKRT